MSRPHDLFDFPKRDGARHPFARHRRNDNAPHFPASLAVGADTELLLVRRLWDDDEVVHAKVEATGARTRIEDADDLVLLQPESNDFADRILRGEQRLRGCLAQHDDVAPPLDLA